MIYSDKLTRADLERIAEDMGIQLWDDIEDFYGARSRRFKTCIRPLHGERGERWRKLSGGYGAGRRRLFACSWYAHYVFFAALFALDPNARVKSALADWRGREDFHSRAPATASINQGSMMYPAYAGELANYQPTISEMRREANEIAAQINPDLPLQPTSESNGSTTYMMNQGNISNCPHFIFSPEHYRQDGTCRCDDPDDEQMAEWGYEWSGQRWN